LSYLLIILAVGATKRHTMLDTGTQFETLDVNEPNVTSYLERFEHHCSACKIAEEQKQSLLYFVIGSKAYDMLKNTCLPEPLHKFSFSQIKDKLLTLFDLKHSEIVERYRFHLLKQSEYEIVSQYVARLKHQVMRCDYEDFSNVMLRDQFVLGIFDDSVRKRLLAESKLTFDRAVELATIVEQVSSDVDAMKKRDSHNEGFHKIIYDNAKYSKRTTNNPSQVKVINCQRCNFKHPYEKCKAYNEYCFACNLKGHFKNSPYCKLKDVKIPHRSLLQTNQDSLVQQQVNVMDYNHLDDVLGITTDFVQDPNQVIPDIRCA